MSREARRGRDQEKSAVDEQLFPTHPHGAKIFPPHEASALRRSPAGIDVRGHKSEHTLGREGKRKLIRNEQRAERWQRGGENGRAKLFTKPLPTGSATITKIMGMVRVCCSMDAVGGVFCVRMSSGFSAMSSFAARCLDSASSSAPQRESIRMLRPSVHPSSWSPSRNAAK
jgi:hypothetical protein